MTSGCWPPTPAATSASPSGCAAGLTEAEQLLSSITAQWRVAGERALAVRGCHHLGQIQRAGGRLDAALGTYQQAVEIVAVPGRPHLPVAGTGYVGMAEVAYQQGELDAAAELATIGAGYAGKSLIRLAIRAGHQVAFATRPSCGTPSGGCT